MPDSAAQQDAARARDVSLKTACDTRTAAAAPLAPAALFAPASDLRATSLVRHSARASGGPTATSSARMQRWLGHEQRRLRLRRPRGSLDGARLGGADVSAA